MVTVTRLRDGVWQLGLRGVNAYLADDDGTLTLLDAGLPRSGDAIRTGIDRAGYAVSDLSRVLVTHYDADHVGGLAGLPHLPVHMGAADIPFYTGEEKPSFRNLKGALQRIGGIFVSPPQGEPRAVADGETVGSFTAYHTPGHTPGHTAFVSDELDAAFVGDLVEESSGRLEASPWYKCYDQERVRESIHDLADRAPAVEVLGMGHGTPFVRDGSVRLAELGERLEQQ